MPLHPQAKALLDLLTAQGLPAIEELGISARASGHDEPDMGGPIESGVAIHHRFITTPTADLPVRIYIPEGVERPLGGMVYFHGGGWVFGHIDSYDSQLVSIAKKTNSIVLSLNYQKAPEHKFPIPHDDCYAALQWLWDHADEYVIDRGKIGVGGDSAGGNLASGVALRVRDENQMALAYQVLIYPANDMNFDSPSYMENATEYGLTRSAMMWFWDQYLDDKDKLNPYAVPMIAKSLENLAPAIVVSAQYDVLRDDTLAYAKRLEEDGVRVISSHHEGHVHGFFSHGKYVDEAYVVRQFIVDSINGILHG
jgi:acetyl esterase